MKNKLAILSLVLIPAICFASFGESFNSLLQGFFGESSVQNVENYETPILEIIEDGDEVDLEGKESLHEAIMREEEQLQNIEFGIDSSEKKLANILSERDLVEFQLQNLDGDLGLVREKQNQYNEAVVRWRRELEGVTQQKSIIDAEVRYAKLQREEALRKKYMRSELSESQDSFSAWNWIFSNKTISQLIEKKRRDEIIEKSQEESLKDLSYLQSKLQQEEKRIARIYLHVQNLEREHAKQQALLADLTNARYKVLARLEFSQGDLMKEIETARQMQVESTVAIQDLRQQLGTEQEIEYTAVLEKLSYPLRLTPRITAKFKDEEYKRLLKREHLGTDLWAPQGTPFYSMGDGVIKKVAQNGYGYSYLIVDHENDLYTVFGHISGSEVIEGQKVSRGDLLGLTGGTPGTPGAGFFTTGAHLHIEVFHEGKHVDPELWME